VTAVGISLAAPIFEFIMKIGIVLAGASYGTKIGNNNFDRDWNLSKDNIKSNLIDCFPNDEVTVYLATYVDSIQNKKLVEFYNPKRAFVLPYQNSHQRTTYKVGLQIVLDDDLDFIISTRFDIKFKDKVSNYNFDYNKVNFLFKDLEPHWTNTRYVGDCLHGIPKKYLNDFVEALSREHESNAWFMHGIYNRLIPMIGENNMHFIFDGNHNSNENQFYELVRANIAG
jgi:hypothetical protein